MGGTTDPGDNNLLVDGNITIGGDTISGGHRGYFFFGENGSFISNGSASQKTQYLDMAQAHQGSAIYGVVMPRAGSITAVSLNYDVYYALLSQYASIPSSASLRVYKNGSSVWSATTLSVSTTGSGRNVNATASNGTYTFSAGDRINLVVVITDVSTGGAYSRVGLDDLTGYIEVTMDN